MGFIIYLHCYEDNHDDEEEDGKEKDAEEENDKEDDDKEDDNEKDNKEEEEDDEDNKEEDEEEVEDDTFFYLRYLNNGHAASYRPTTAIQPSCHGVEVGRCRQSSHYPTKAT